jgi:hypothetical protein
VLLVLGFEDAHLAGGVLRGRVQCNVVRIADLVRDENRGDVLEVAQLDDFVVDRRGRDGVQAGRRIVEEKQPRLRRIALAIATRRRCPPDSSDGIRSM